MPLDNEKYLIPRKTVIVPNLTSIMNNPKDFPNPEKFEPERYLVKDQAGQLRFQPHPKVIPFGIGKRRCLGESLARTSLYKFFTALVQKYEITSSSSSRENMAPIDDKAQVGFVKSPMTYQLVFKPIKC